MGEWAEKIFRTVKGAWTKEVKKDLDGWMKQRNEIGRSGKS